jgi:hypothetical protein
VHKSFQILRYVVREDIVVQAPQGVPEKKTICSWEKFKLLGISRDQSRVLFCCMASFSWLCPALPLVNICEEATHAEVVGFSAALRFTLRSHQLGRMIILTAGGWLG